LAVWQRGEYRAIASNLTPEYAVTTGRRRSGHGLPEDLRWWVYWDAPLTVPGPKTGNTDLPRKAEEVRRYDASFRVTGCRVSTRGSRLEVDFDGLSMGVFTGGLRFTVYRGTNLIRQDAVAKTEEPSLAYIYRGGLKGFPADNSSALHWVDTGGREQTSGFGGAPNEGPVALRARNRVAIYENRNGSVAVFPPPHQFFFARQLEVNLGFVWYRKDSDRTLSLGVRQHESHEGYNPTWVERVWALFNAPPGTQQRMPVYFYVSPLGAEQTRRQVMALTRNDKYQPLSGYKTMVTHFHTAFTEELSKAGSLDHQAPWIPAMRALGVNIAYICDFHGDGHPEDTGPVRIKELEQYYAACRRHSDRDFLILPGEEPNAYLGGHYNILFPKPVYWTLRRASGSSFVEQHPNAGKVYHTADAADVFRMLEAEDALVWQTHPRTKGSTGFPDEIREKDYFKSDQWIGGGFKALPVDLSEKRLCDRRCFDTLDDMNNWGRPKFLLGEVDTYKKFPDYELFGDFNVNYVEVDPLPSFDDWRPLHSAIKAGRFFTTTGEVLIRRFAVEGTGDQRTVVAEVEWTFPLEFVEIVWGDGSKTERTEVPATDLAPFGRRQFRIPWNAAGKKWVRFAAWDSAVNGAFTQPVHIR
jgi:hypothetical protein